MTRFFSLFLALLAASPALAEDPITELQGACHSTAGSVGQVASLLSPVGWQVGGDFERAIEARAMVLPYLSGRGEQDLRRNALTYYKDEALAQAAEEAVLSGFMTSPEGHTLMIIHTGRDIYCTLALARGTLAVQVLDAMPDRDFEIGKGNDPQMTWNIFSPNPPPPGVTGAEIALYDSDADDYTRINPVRPRDVDLIVTTRARLP